ncbi:PaaI family thioesterase [Hydrocarboniclastica marina]|uniref:PaaI family thioesterase n=1 Tax=Hydrocarboniclastica marina TaxID=2259620 RepID=A0A4P7XLE5_9ALTE|nr:PaaI family thioesterase [Hydrocarboniclastica marina]MAM59861.1 thioesterase [Maritimibacter sp.]QCF28069.1 PaaI family thioesterase [Hydrocarboniclastica marina]|tara:strand:+ start:1748 stop:2230 length:483 start_codon:yes stop_codon:yes gene_type:complete
MTESKSVHSDAARTAWQFTEQVPHGRDLGMQVVSISGNQVCMSLTPQPWMLADEGTEEICTGVLYSLADSASGLAVFAEAQDLSPIATLDIRMDYFRPAVSDRTLSAVATCRHLNDEVAFIHCDVLSEGDNQPVATGRATFMRNTRGRSFRTASGRKGEA